MVMERFSLTEVMVMTDSDGNSDGGECCFFSFDDPKSDHPV